MRGKLRDKRTFTRRDSIKRDLAERRKPNKRDARTVLWLRQPDDDEFDLDLLEEEEQEEPIMVPDKTQNKK